MVFHYHLQREGASQALGVAASVGDAATAVPSRCSAATTGGVDKAETKASHATTVGRPASKVSPSRPDVAQWREQRLAKAAASAKALVHSPPSVQAASRTPER